MSGEQPDYSSVRDGYLAFFLDLSTIVAVHTVLASAVRLDLQHEHAALESASTALERRN
jgi:hypothetical protein